jgi:hypothetical protein
MADNLGDAWYAEHRSEIDAVAQSLQSQIQAAAQSYQSEIEAIGQSIGNSVLRAAGL